MLCLNRYDLELHMVHQNPDPTLKNQVAVIGVLYRIGKPDAFLSRVSPLINKKKKTLDLSRL